MAQIGPGLCNECKVKVRPKRNDRKNAWRSTCWACSEKSRAPRVRNRGKIISIKNTLSLICEECNFQLKYRRTDRINSYRKYCSGCLSKLSKLQDIGKSSDNYVRGCIRACGYKGKISKEMLETKKLSLKLYRAIRKFSNSNKNQTKEA